MQRAGVEESSVQIWYLDEVASGTFRAENHRPIWQYGMFGRPGHGRHEGGGQPVESGGHDLRGAEARAPQLTNGE